MTDLNTLSKQELIQKLKEAQEQLSILMDNIPGGFLSYDANTGKLLTISKGILAMFGCSEEQFRDMFYDNFELMIAKENREQTLESIKEQLNFFDTVELTYKVNNTAFYQEIWIYHKARKVLLEDGREVFYAVLNDVTEEKQVQKSVNDLTQQLYEKLEKDGMTGLLKKESMIAQINEYLQQDGKNEVNAVLMIDTDNFKSVNDTFGHAYGDEIIRFVASAIDDNFRNTDFKARMGGDEFMVFMKNTDRRLVEERAKLLNELIRRECRVGDDSVNISCSIGIAYYPIHGFTFEELFKSADEALYKAKELGKDRFVSM